MDTNGEGRRREDGRRTKRILLGDRTITVTEKDCPCGETFMPTHPAQVYHRKDCPARTNGNSASAAQRRRKSSRTRKRGGQARKPRQATTAPSLMDDLRRPSLMVALSLDCKAEVERIDGEIAPIDARLRELTVEVAKLQADKATLQQERQTVVEAKKILHG